MLAENTRAQMIDSQPIESLDERLVNVTRFILALSALLITYVDPSEPYTHFAC